MIEKVAFTCLVACGVITAPLQADEGVVLKYRFKPGRVLRYDGQHSLTVESTVSGSKHKLVSHSSALREWKVLAVDERGNAQLSMTIVRVRMETTPPDGTKRTFDTEAGNAPQELAAVVGKPLVEVTLAPDGKVMRTRELGSNGAAHFAPHMRTVLCPFPTTSITPGTTWQQNIRLPLAPGSDEQVEVRRTFRLERIQGNVATIGVQTAPAQRIPNKEVMVRLAQFLPAGRFQFDVSEGVLQSQEMKLDETVTGFAGEESVMSVTGYYRERLIEDVAQGSSPRN